MERGRAALAALVLCLALAGCGPVGSAGEPAAGYENIAFQEGQWYAAAYLGFGEMEDADYYRETYLKGADFPIHYISPGEFYLIIPRYPDMAVRLYSSDINSADPVLIFEAASCVPFAVQCNVSDIFADVTVELTRQGETVAFSPYISLKDGGAEIGEKGLELTKAE